MSSPPSFPNRRINPSTKKMLPKTLRPFLRPMKPHTISINGRRNANIAPRWILKNLNASNPPIVIHITPNKVLPFMLLKSPHSLNCCGCLLFACFAYVLSIDGIQRNQNGLTTVFVLDHSRGVSYILRPGCSRSISAERITCTLIRM